MSWTEAIFERWSEAFKLRLMMGAFLLFIVSAVTSCSEVRYAAFGTKTQATIEKIESITKVNRYGDESNRYRFSYSFTDKDGTIRKEDDDVPGDWPLPLGSTVEVRYISGAPDRSRLAGHNRWFMTIPFFACGAICIGATIVWYRGFQDHQRRVEASRR